MPTNPFSTETAARVYAAGRPDYSSRVTPMIDEMVGHRFERAVDIGAGTGISTKALAPLAREVIGVEVSKAMIERAHRAPTVMYVLGSAEQLPLADQAFDLIGAGSAVHWFDQQRFLDETSRVATPGAWLLVHDHWFTAQLEGDEEFLPWFRNSYLDRYPSPPRDRSWRPPEDLGAWRHHAWRRYEHAVTFDPASLADYLLTQSNLQTVMESGDESEDDLRHWLLTETAGFFPGGREVEFIFAGFVSCHRRDP